MLRSLLALHNYRIQAIDDDVGIVKDGLFDDSDWIVRYLVVDTGRWLAGRHVLVSPLAVRRAERQSRYLRVMLTRDQIRESPDVDAHLPVSRQAEQQLAAYHGWPAYWNSTKAVRALSASPGRASPSGDHDGDIGNPTLRSMREVTGCRITARGEFIGRVRDLLADRNDWCIRYLVAHLGSEEHHRHALLSPDWINHANWEESSLSADVAPEKIGQAPPYQPGSDLTREFEERLHGHYDRPTYWNAT